MKKIVKLIDLDCANCAAKIENAIQKIDGVEKASVSFMTQKMTIEAPEGQKAYSQTGTGCDCTAVTHPQRPTRKEPLL